MKIPPAITIAAALAVAVPADAVSQQVRFESTFATRGRVSSGTAQAGAMLVRASGFRCDSISGADKFIFSSGMTLHCNNYNYSYDVRDRGGRWVVSVK